jgi:hypothetical protein
VARLNFGRFHWLMKKGVYYIPFAYLSTGQGKKGLQPSEVKGLRFAFASIPSGLPPLTSFSRLFRKRRPGFRGKPRLFDVNL